MGTPRKPKPAAPPRHVTAAQFAERIGVSRSTVSDWIKAGLLDVDEDGRVPLVQGMRQVKQVRRMRAGLGAAPSTSDNEVKTKAQSALTRTREATAALRELELAAARGDLVERAEVDSWADPIAEWVEGRDRVTVLQVWTECLKGDAARMTRREEMRIAHALQQARFVRTRIRSGQSMAWAYVPAGRCS